MRKRIGGPGRRGPDRRWMTWTPQAKEGDCVQVSEVEKKERLLLNMELIIDCEHSRHTVGSKKG